MCLCVNHVRQLPPNWTPPSCIAAGKDINKVPASGPAPVIIRFDDWMVIGSDYERLSFEMETDAPMVKQLGEST